LAANSTRGYIKGGELWCLGKTEHLRQRAGCHSNDILRPGKMNSPYSMSSEESCIQEAIAQFYSFFGQMQSLKNHIEQLNDLDDVTRNRIMYQLDNIERELALLLAAAVVLGVGESKNTCDQE